MLATVFVLFGIAALLGLAAMPRARTTRLATGSWVVLGAASVVAVVAGGRAMTGHGSVVHLDGWVPLQGAALRVDRLSGMFLVITLATAVPALVAAVRADVVSRRRLPAAMAGMLASVVVVMTADNFFVLLFGWEGLTLTFLLLVGYDRALRGRASASVVAVSAGKVSGAALLIGGLLLCAPAHSFVLDAWTAVPGGAGRSAAYLLLLLGFAVKIGLVPLHVWLPTSYAASPGPARPLMAGVAANAGFYGMWRTLQLLGAPPVWLAVLIVVLGGVGAILGIAHASVQPDLLLLIAWSSVENAGLITAGFGVALVGEVAKETDLVAAGLLAATAQIIAHSLGKTLLFTAAAGIEQDTGTTALDRLRGLCRQVPWAGWGLVIGALTLAGLPLTAGFASEWLLLESFMQQFRVEGLALQLACASAGALVALTIGVAGLTFVRLVGLTALGSANGFRKERTAAQVDARPGFRAGIVMLALGCLGVAAVAPLEVRLIARGLSPIVGDAASGGNQSRWVLQPVFSDFSALSPTWLWIIIPAFTAGAVVLGSLFSRGGLWRVRRAPVWSSGSPGVDRGVGYTSVAFANPMRHVLANMLQTSGTIESADGHARPASADSGTPSARPSGVPGPRLRYVLDVVEVVERYLYRPLQVCVLVASRLARRLQSGYLDAYLTYMLIALVAMLALVLAAT